LRLIVKHLPTRHEHSRCVVGQKEAVTLVPVPVAQGTGRNPALIRRERAVLSGTTYSLGHGPELAVSLKSGGCNRSPPVEVTLVPLEDSIQQETRDENDNGKESVLNNGKLHLLTKGKWHSFLQRRGCRLINEALRPNGPEMSGEPRRELGR